MPLTEIYAGVEFPPDINDAAAECDAETFKAITRADEQLDRGEGRDLRDVATEFRAKHRDKFDTSNV